MDYNSFRHFADSYGLVFLLMLFTGFIVWALFRPGAKKSADEAAQIPLKED